MTRLRLALLTILGCFVACGLALALTAHPTPRPLLPYVEIAPAISGNGQVVAFEMCRGGAGKRVTVRRGEGGDVTDIVRVDLETGLAVRVTAGANGSSVAPSLDERGDTLAFASEASDLVPQDGDAVRNVFLWSGGVVRRVSPPSLSVGRSSSGEPFIAGGRLAFLTYGVADGGRVPVVCGVDGLDVVAPVKGNVLCYGRPMFAEGRLVFSASVNGGEATLWAYDGALKPLVGGAPAFEPATSTREVAFSSPAALLPDDTNGAWDVYVKGACLERISVSSDGVQGDDASAEPCISRDGRFVAFTSYARTFGASGSNVYLRDRVLRKTRLISHRADGGAGNGVSFRPAMSGDGARIVFVSMADDLDASANVRGRVYVWERATDAVRALPLPTP